MTTTNSPIVTDERPREAGQVQEQAETVQETTSPLSAEQKYHNAGAEVERIKAELLDKRQAIEDHAVQIALVRQKHKEAEQAHSIAATDEREYEEKVLRQQSLVKIGGPAEQAALQVMQTEQERLAKDSEFTRQNLEEAEKLLEIIPAIVEDLQKVGNACAQLEHEQSVMESIWSEMLYRWGKEEQEALIAELEADKEELEAKERAHDSARESLRATQQSVKKRLRYWPGMAEHVENTYVLEIKEKEKGMSAEEHVFHAKIDYMRTLGEWGPKCRTHLHKTPIRTYLQLPEQTIGELMHPMAGLWQIRVKDGEREPTNHLIESAEWFIEEARQNRNS
jgi:hypothetical protein